MVRTKICCIRDENELALAVRAGAAALGFVSHMPSGPGVISEDVIARLTAATPFPVYSEVLTSLTTADELVAQVERLRPAALQLCERVAPAVFPELRRRARGVRLMQVIHVSDRGALEVAEAYAPLVDALLLDTGRTEGPRRELGGTGRTHDWSVDAEIVRRVQVPVFLAGGLNAANVGEAIATVRPFGVDVCTGVRTDDRLDPDKLHRFMAAVRAAG
ncbi:phosphoribosylanthranilate isomerase [bacterium]|nr:phosphoribosylanthranilate isomerase [bacterium]